jgi:hypothetical protein
MIRHASLMNLEADHADLVALVDPLESAPSAPKDACAAVLVRDEMYVQAQQALQA